MSQTTLNRVQNFRFRSDNKIPSRKLHLRRVQWIRWGSYTIKAPVALWRYALEGSRPYKCLCQPFRGEQAEPNKSIHHLWHCRFPECHVRKSWLFKVKGKPQPIFFGGDHPKLLAFQFGLRFKNHKTGTLSTQDTPILGPPPRLFPPTPPFPPARLRAAGPSDPR